MFSLIFSLLTTSFAYNNNNHNVDYILTYTGDKEIANSYRFSTAFDDNYLLEDEITDGEICRQKCAKNKKCLGLYEEESFCRMLSNLGIPVQTNISSYSYTKIVHYNYKNPVHTLTGDIYDVTDFPNKNKNTTIYLDLNHNGILDDEEPYEEVPVNSGFQFNNLTDGLYLIRQVVPDGCYQLYPGLNSTFIIYKGDGFADNVIKYIHYGHRHHPTAHGGIIGDSEEYLNSNFSFILGSDNTTYLSFYANYSITLGFFDETIVDNPGMDLFIDVYNDSNITANVSVSSDDITFHMIGVLNTSNITSFEDIHRQSFDLRGYHQPVGFIKLDFIGNNTKEQINILNVGIYERSIYLPEYGYLVQVPNDDWIFFFNDCNYFFNCDTYCGLNFYYRDDYYSCVEGCNIFEKTNNCNCLDYDEALNFYEYYDDDSADDQSVDGSFNYQMCENGCIYNIKKNVYPNYTVHRESTGLLKNRIDILNNSIYELIDTCNDDNICGSIDLDINGGGNLYNSHKYVSHQNFTFLTKNNHFTTTSTTNTLTSTTNTLTSTTNTLTSTTDTSTTNTLTSTTDTSTTQTSTTDTSTTQTSTTFTDTSTTQTSTTFTDTSTTDTSLLINPNRANDKKSLSEKDLIPLYAILGIIGAGGMAFGVTKVINKKRENNLNETLNSSVDGFSNPAYGLQQENIDLDNNEEPNSYYQDVDVANLSDGTVGDDYLEIGED